MQTICAGFAKQPPPLSRQPRALWCCACPTWCTPDHTCTTQAMLAAAASIAAATCSSLQTAICPTRCSLPSSITNPGHNTALAHADHTSKQPSCTPCSQAGCASCGCQHSSCSMQQPAKGTLTHKLLPFLQHHKPSSQRCSLPSSIMRPGRSAALAQQTTPIDLSRQPSCTPCSLLHHTGHACSFIQAVVQHVGCALHMAQAVVGRDLVHSHLQVADRATSPGVHLDGNKVWVFCTAAPAAHKGLFL